MAHIGFQKLETQLAAKPGIYNPGGLTEHIGEKKYGAAGFKALQAAGRKKKKAADLFKSTKSK